MVAEYAWIITHDHLGDEFGGGSNVGVSGPSDAPAELLAEAEANGRVFRIYDDDGELYYTGRIATVPDVGAGSELDFGPLEDFGTPNDGATEIRYREGNRWVAL